MNIVLILAGGIGSRSGESIPKQFVKINEKPLIIYTLEKFEQNSNIDLICIACHKDYIETMKLYVEQFNISKAKMIIMGGATGLESAYNGIIEINKIAGDDSLVLIHDAVRPFINQESIDNNVEVARKYGLAMCSVPLVETLAYSEDGIIAPKIVARDNLHRILTPQTFKLSILNELYSDESVLKSNHPSTFSLYMSKGLPIYLSKGSEKNIKITYPEDIQYFKKFFE